MQSGGLTSANTLTLFTDNTVGAENVFYVQITKAQTKEIPRVVVKSTFWRI